MIQLEEEEPFLNEQNGWGRGIHLETENFERIFKVTTSLKNVPKSFAIGCNHFKSWVSFLSTRGGGECSLNVCLLFDIFSIPSVTGELLYHNSTITIEFSSYDEEDIKSPV